MFSVFTLKYMMSLRGTSSQFSRKLKGTPGELEDVLEMSFLIVEHQSGFNRTSIRVRVPWTARRSNQSTLNEINPEYSLEGLMLKLKLKILWPPDAKESTHWKNPCCWERLKVGGEGNDRGQDGWMASPTQWT